jgi:hypothetical protein
LHALFLCFEAVSGLKINMTKSELVLVGNVHNVVGWPVFWVVGCLLLAFEVSWPSFMSFFKAKSIWDGVIKKIERRLAG